MVALLDKPARGSKQKLITATAELLIAQGFECTGINEILKKAKVTKSNFYYHFKSKEELCLVALDAIAEYYFDHILSNTLLNRGISPQKRLQRYMRMTIEKMADSCCCQGCPFINLGNETSDFYPSFRSRIVDIYNRQIEALETCYREGVECGEFNGKLAPGPAAKFILSELNGTILLGKVYKKTEILKENFKTLFELIT